MNLFSRPVQITLISAFTINFAGFAVMTFLTIYLTAQLYFSPLQVGVILSVMTVASRILPFFSGMMGDKIGHVYMMFFGLLARGGGFFFFSFFHNFEAIVVAAALTGMGTALYEPSASAIFSSQPEHIRKKAFLVLNQCLNGGAIAGPLAGALLIHFDPLYLFLTSGCLFWLLACILFVQRKSFHIRKNNRASSFEGLKHIISNKPFVNYSLTMILFWFMYSQLTVSLLIKMFALSNNESFVSLVITTNAITGLVFMILFTKIYEACHTFDILKIGVLLMGVSLIMVSWLNAPFWLLACVIIFTIGETLVLPSSDIAVSDFSHSQFTATYFGFFDISVAIGSIAGSFAGTWLMSIMGDHYLPWLLFGLSGMIGSLLLHFQSHGSKKILSKHSSYRS